MVNATFLSYTQESISPLSSNPYIKDEKKNVRKSFQASKSKNLPFFDDFSKADNSSFPNDTLWLNSKMIYINNHFGLEPISLGVATFDALNASGKLYDNADYKSFHSDTLTSNYINLSGKKASDSIYLSFFYQAGGFGEMPDENDSLFLQFARPGTKSKYWDTVWSVRGGEKTRFKQVIFPITNEHWLKDSFQFRLINTASVNITSNDPGKNTNGDIWNLDYVYLNQFRNYTDSAYKHDIAIIYPPEGSLLKSFERMPWSQFKLPNVYQNERGDKVSIPIKSYRPVITDINAQIYFYDILDNMLEIDLLNFSTPIPSNEMFYVQDNIPNLISEVSDTFALFEMKMILNVDKDDNQQNNTVRYIQEFSNYFSYDDGTAEYGYGISGEGSINAMLALRYKTYRSELLTAVDMFINESIESTTVAKKNFDLVIWNERKGLPGDTLYKKPIVFSKKNEWQRFLLDTAVVVPEVFYVGWVQKTPAFANVGFDVNRSASQHAFFNLQGTPEGWKPSAINGALMIHPVIDSKANVQQKSKVSPGQIKVFPNPAIDILEFDLPPDYLGQNFKIEINSITGTFNLIRNQAENRLNISELHPGIYIIKITDPQGNTFSSKFVKNAR